MDDCCPPSGCSVPESGKPKARTSCAACGREARPVARQTMLFQLKHAELMTVKDISFRFCANADCDVVYFGDDGTTYTEDHMRQKVGQKSTSPDRTICYCFDVTESTVREQLSSSGESESKAFVMEQVKRKACACEVRNPSGQCCLKDFPKN